MNPQILLMTISVGTLLLFVILSGAVAIKCYKRAGPSEALVRSGSGGDRVVIGGGIVAYPGLHGLTRVPLRTIKLSVERSDRRAVVTRDGIRVNVAAEVFIKVNPTTEDVLRAARTLGEKTLDETSARDLLGSSIEEALIAVAADSKFDDLRSSPGEVCDKVQSGLREAAAQVGMDIASIKLTELSPVPLRQLDPNDRIDARAILAVEDLAKRAGLAKQELLALLDGARGSAGAGGFKA